MLLDQGMQIFICSNCCPASARSSSAWFRIVLASMSRTSSSGVCGGFSSGGSCRWALGITFRWITRSGQVSWDLHAGRTRQPSKK